jgi:NlpC/P60 family putative phage cell wall peptidase
MPSEPHGVLPEALVAEARRWLGTPFRHQGRIRGEGVDCIGLVLEPARALGLTDYRPAAYARLPDAGTMREELVRHLIKVARSDMRPGDVLLLAAPLSPSHLALVGELGGALTMIHASGPIGRVVEHGIDATWAGRIRGVFRFPGLAEPETA